MTDEFTRQQIKNHGYTLPCPHHDGLGERTILAPSTHVWFNEDPCFFATHSFIGRMS